MKLPRWIPRWVIRLMDLALGSETVDALQCDCGTIFDMEPGEDAAVLAARLDAHNRFFHPERVSQ